MARDIHKALNKFEKKKQDNIIENDDILEENKELIIDFLDWKKQDLQNKKGREEDDKIRWSKTLNKYVGLLKNVGEWVDKPLDEFTKEDVQRLYDKLEEGKIKSKNGKKYSHNSRLDYYKKVFKSDFTKRIDKELYQHCKDIMKVTSKESKVRFFEKEDFDDMLLSANNLRDKVLLSLLFDTGMRIGTVLNLKKGDFEKKKDDEINETYYIIRVKKNYTKSNKARSIHTWLDKTSKLLDKYLKDLENGDLLFDISYRYARKIIRRIAKKSDVKVKPEAKTVKPHDFRRSSATYWLKRGMRQDSIKARLGHKPSSTVIDKYVNYLGLDKHKQRKKVNKQNISDLKEKYEKTKNRLKSVEKDLNRLKEHLKEREEKTKELNDLLKEEDVKEFLEDKMIEKKSE